MCEPAWTLHVGGPREDASIVTLWDREKLSERRVMKGLYAKYHTAFAVERQASRRSHFCQLTGIEWKAMGNLRLRM